MKEEYIRIRGARMHNLQNVHVRLPKHRLIVVTGISGSGKSSLAFDTLYAEGQRRYVESLSSYARQFLGLMEKPDVDSIEGISPAISIDQRKGAHNPRSTVGTTTEIYDYLRLLFARVGKAHCYQCGSPVARQTVDQMARLIKKFPAHTEFSILAPVIKGKKGEHQGVFEDIAKQGFSRVRVNGKVVDTRSAIGQKLDRYKMHTIEVVVDRLVAERDMDTARLVDSLETGLKLGKGTVSILQNKKNTEIVLSEHFACEKCGISLPGLEPRLFSFNSPYGACPSCEGLGEKLEVKEELVMPNPSLSLSEGAIFPWAHASHKVGRQGFFWWKLEEACRKMDIDPDIPVRSLSKEQRTFLLRGDAEWEGVIPSLERRYRETDSEFARAEMEKYMVEKTCEDCQGKRLRKEALGVTVGGATIHEIVSMQIDHARAFFVQLGSGKKLRAQERQVADLILKEIVNRLEFLEDVGLEYLTLERKATTLSGGEAQRIRLATQIGAKLSGVLYILDEPSIGLHARDQKKLIATLKKLRDLGNTVVVVEHDPQTIRAADWIVELGPGAGTHGGKIVFEGTPAQLKKSKTLTGDYMSGRKKVTRILPEGEVSDRLLVKGAQEHNLKDIDCSIPLGMFVCMTGVSGSGKSSLVNDILAKALMKKFYKSTEEPGAHTAIMGSEFLDKVVVVDQSPIGRTPRSNPATYTGLFAVIRDLFSKTKEAKVRGYGPGRFSFNVKSGRCEACEGQGVKKIEMFFLPDVYVECAECKGKRFNEETLKVEYRGKNIAQVLDMTVEEAVRFFAPIPSVAQRLNVLKEVGLGYIRLGQSAPSLSGGEAQRVKLATELAKRNTGRTLYILDEPTTGLHTDDVRKLVFVLSKLVEKNNTVLVIEHNIDFIRSAQWCIDLGPEGGEKGGVIVAEGTPQSIARNKQSVTGKYL